MYGMTTAHPSNYTKGRSARIEFLVLHYTAGHNDSAAGNLRYFASPRGASAHYFVDRDGWRQSVSDEDTAWSVGTAGIYQSVPACDRAWAVGSPAPVHPLCRNTNSISIEMCCRYDAGRYWLEDVVVANAALLTRKLMRKYGIPIENVLRHYDVVSKRCPAMWVDDENAWFAFKRQVMEVMEMTKEELLSLKDTGDYPSDWAREATQWAKQTGVFTGDSAGNFGWQQPVTREAVAKLLYEYDQMRSVDSGAADMVK